MIIDYPGCPDCGATGHVLNEIGGWHPCAVCTPARREAERAARAVMTPETDVVDGIPDVDDAGNAEDDTYGDFADLD